MIENLIIVGLFLMALVFIVLVFEAVLYYQDRKTEDEREEVKWGLNY